MLYGIEDEPSLFPAFQESSTFVKIALVCSIFRDVTRELFVILLGRSLYRCNAGVYAPVVTAASRERVRLQIVRYGFVLGAVFRYGIGAFVVTNVSAVHASETSLYRSPQNA